MNANTRLNTCKICLPTKNLIWSSFILNEVIYIQTVMLLKVRSHSLTIAQNHMFASAHARYTNTHIFIHFAVAFENISTK